MKKIFILLAVMICFTDIATAQDDFVELLKSNLSELNPDGQNPFTFDNKGFKNEIYVPKNTTSVYFGIVFKPQNSNNTALENAKETFKKRHSDIVCNIDDGKACLRYKRNFNVLNDETADLCAAIAWETEEAEIFDNLRRCYNEFYDIYQKALTDVKQKEQQQAQETQQKQNTQPKTPPYLNVEGPTNIDCEGGVKKYEVKTNTDYSIYIPYENEYWIHVRNKKSPLDHEVYMLEIEYNKNSGASVKSGSFTVNGKGLSKTINIMQDGCKTQPTTQVVEKKKKYHYHHEYEDYFWYIKFGVAADYWKFYDADGKEDKNFSDYDIPQIGYNLVFGFDDLIAGPLFWGLNFGFSSNGYKLDYTKGDNSDVEYLLCHNFQVTPYLGLAARFSRNFAMDFYFGPYCGYDYFGVGKNTWKYNNEEYTYKYRIWNDDDSYWYDGGYNHFHYGLNFSVGFWFGEIFNIDFNVQQGLSDIIKQSNDAYVRSFNAMARIGFKI